MAAEEEVRARAASRKAKYSGPMLRYHSKKQGDASVVCPRPSQCGSCKAGLALRFIGHQRWMRGGGARRLVMMLLA